MTPPKNFAGQNENTSSELPRHGRIQPEFGVLLYFSEKMAFAGDALPGWDAILQSWHCVQCYAVFEHFPANDQRSAPFAKLLCPFCKQSYERQKSIRACVRVFRSLTYSRSLELWQDLLLSAVAEGLDIPDSVSQVFCGDIDPMRQIYAFLRQREKERNSEIFPTQEASAVWPVASPTRDEAVANLQVPSAVR